MALVPTFVFLISFHNGAMQPLQLIKDLLQLCCFPRYYVAWASRGNRQVSAVVNKKSMLDVGQQVRTVAES